MRFLCPLAAVAFATTVSSACASTSPSMETATGMLKVNGETTSHDGYYDSNMDYHGPGSFYTFKSFTVGEQEVDELTFFHVAGDTAREQQVLEWRKKNNTANAVGWTASGVGIGTVIGGVALLGVAGADDPEGFLTTPLGQASMGLMAVGGIIVGASFYATVPFAPDRPLNQHELVLDPIGDAEVAAERKNAELRGETPPPPEAPEASTPTDG